MDRAMTEHHIAIDPTTMGSAVGVGPGPVLMNGATGNEEQHFEPRPPAGMIESTAGRPAAPIFVEPHVLMRAPLYNDWDEV